jgi:SSS family solute:Na+ symporter
LTGTALALAIYLPNMLVNLLLTGYSGVTQFFPMIVLGLFWKSSTKIASFAGLLVGEFLVFYLMLNKLDPLTVGGLHLNAGFVALVANMAVFVIISLVTRTPAGIERKMRAIDGMDSSPIASTTVSTR